MEDVPLTIRERHDVAKFEVVLHQVVVLLQALEGDLDVEQPVVGICCEEVEGGPEAVRKQRLLVVGDGDLGIPVQVLARERGEQVADVDRPRRAGAGDRFQDGLDVNATSPPPPVLRNGRDAFEVLDGEADEKS